MKIFTIAGVVASMAAMIPTVMSIPQPNAESISVAQNHTLDTNVLQARVGCPGNTDPNQIYCDYVNNLGSSVACDKIIHKLSNLTPDTKYTGAECDWDSIGNRCCISWNTMDLTSGVEPTDARICCRASCTKSGLSCLGVRKRFPGIDYSH